MADVAFSEIRYSVEALLDEIMAGRIGLPEVQRTFVWDDIKVRDLFDSMYKGYPVGYLLLWDDGSSLNPRLIGRNTNSVARPSLLILDGQQRLTSLLAVIKGQVVKKINGDEHSIYISFDPLEKDFAVQTPEIANNKRYMDDISKIWTVGARFTATVQEYIDELCEYQGKSISQDDESEIERSLLKLRDLTKFQFSALQLARNVEYSDVCDIFIRINREGVQLDDADLLLALMSKFSSGSNKALDDFRTTMQGQLEFAGKKFAPYLDPLPASLLMTAMGLGFGTIGLEEIKGILDNEHDSRESRRKRSEESLRQSLDSVLDQGNWTSFMFCVHSSGLRRDTYATTKRNWTSLLYSLYLLGRTKFDIDDLTLRPIFARLAFEAELISAVRTTTSFQEILAKTNQCVDRDSFTELLQSDVDFWGVDLTEGFWNDVLPRYIFSAPTRDVSWNVFCAALVILEAPALLAEGRMVDLLEFGSNEAMQIQYLFRPNEKEILDNTSELSSAWYMRDREHMVNRAFLPSPIGSDLAVYIANHERPYTRAQLGKMYGDHALPNKWSRMEYSEFRHTRSRLMAHVIRDAYEQLTGRTIVAETKLDVLLNEGESDKVEFKEVLRSTDKEKRKPISQDRVSFAVTKAIASFLNSDGGTLIIGVDDNGEPTSNLIEDFESEDKALRHLGDRIVNVLRSDAHVTELIDWQFEDCRNGRPLVVRCKRSQLPVFAVQKQDKQRQPKEVFYYRNGPESRPLEGSELARLLRERF